MTQPVGYECPFDVSGSGHAAGPLVPTAPILELAVAGILFAGVLGLRLFFGSPVDAYSMLYALPIALVATTFGLRAGTFAGLLAVGLTVLWAMTQSVHPARHLRPPTPARLISPPQTSGWLRRRQVLNHRGLPDRASDLMAGPHRRFSSSSST